MKVTVVKDEVKPSTRMLRTLSIGAFGLDARGTIWLRGMDSAMRLDTMQAFPVYGFDNGNTGSIEVTLMPVKEIQLSV